MQNFFSRFGVVPKVGGKRLFLFLIYFLFFGINVKDASSGT